MSGASLFELVKEIYDKTAVTAAPRVGAWFRAGSAGIVYSSCARIGPEAPPGLAAYRRLLPRLRQTKRHLEESPRNAGQCGRRSIPHGRFDHAPNLAHLWESGLRQR